MSRATLHITATLSLSLLPILSQMQKSRSLITSYRVCAHNPFSIYESKTPIDWCWNSFHGLNSWVSEYGLVSKSLKPSEPLAVQILTLERKNKTKRLAEPGGTRAGILESGWTNGVDVSQSLWRTANQRINESIWSLQVPIWVLFQFNHYYYSRVWFALHALLWLVCEGVAKRDSYISYGPFAAIR